MIQFKLTHKNAKVPARGSVQAAGLDLHAAERTVIPPGERVIVPTGLQMSIPDGTVGLIWPRSGNAVKHGIDVMAGVIDSDYRGDIGVVLINHSDVTFTAEVGDKVAQMIMQAHFSAMPITVVESLDDTDRGDGAYGSTDQ